MITASSDLKNIFYNDITVKSGVGCTIEHNMNSLIDGITVTSNTITDAQYVNSITGTWPSSKPNPFKKLFPIDSVIKPFRPLNSGIQYYIVGGQYNILNPKSSSYSTTQPRIYYPGISTVYKYWVSPKNTGVDILVRYLQTLETWAAAKLNGDIPKTSGDIPLGNKSAMANKIVVRFEKYHDLPANYHMVIIPETGTTITTSNFSIASDGNATLYYNGTTWNDTVPTTYPAPQLIKSIQLITPSAGTDKIIGVIEISARWIKDISSDITTIDVTKESSATIDDILPVGNITSNNITLNLANYNQTAPQIISYNRASTSFDPLVTYIAKNSEFSPYFNIYHSLGLIGSGTDKHDNVLQGKYYADTWSIDAYGETLITALDGAKYLMETLCPDALCERYSVTAILRRLLDAVGFTNYNFNLTTNDQSVPVINYWWTDDTNTVWQAIQELCRDIQMNAFFDENNILQFYSREYMYTKETIDWQFYYEKESSKLANIVDFNQKDIASANQVKVLWSSPTLSNYMSSGTGLWTSPTSFIAAGGLMYEILADSTAENTILMLDLNMSTNINQYQSLFNFSGYVLIDSEVIEYDAIQYLYVPILNDDGSDNNINTAKSAMITSQSDIDKYRYLSKPGFADPSKPETSFFRPSGRYRVKTRGALGTTPAYHNKTGANVGSQWSGWEVVFK